MADAVADVMEGRSEHAALRRPRVGFLGVGWIGRDRMAALVRDGIVDAAAVADPDPAAREQARSIAAHATVLDSPAMLLEHAGELDAVVIATPSAQHAEQSIAALERGLAIYCQKPLGRSAAEAQRVVDAARAADRLLGVDMCYRHTRAGAAVAEQVRRGGLGRIYAADLVFHNAYGPDKPWFYDARHSGGGCVMDLGIHLVDLLMWILDRWVVDSVDATLYSQGHLLDGPGAVEDHALATLRLSDGVTARLTCSWNLHAGRDAVIEATFYGTEGAASLRNVNGSFYDFTAERVVGTHAERLIDPPDQWGGRAIRAWAAQLARDGSFDPQAERLPRVAAAIDAIYATCAS